ncbi:MAG: hypothetical protein ACREDE_03035 [Thermoplasmata archaeon]
MLLLAVFVLSIASLATPWWSYSASAGGNSESVNFLPGSNYNITCAGHCGGFSAGSFPYTAIGGSLGGLYEGVLILVALSAVLTGLAALFGGLRVLGRSRAPNARRWAFLGSGIAAVVLLGAIVWTASAQPGAFPAGSALTGSGSGGASPATSFWGSNPAGSASWGAGVGWYLALASVVLIIVVIGMLLVLDRQRPREPERRTSATAAPPGAVAYTAPPYASPSTGPTVTRPPLERNGASAPTPEALPPPAEDESKTMVPCPNCGTSNLVRSRTCSYCQRPLR